jgi:hypothetical protein
MFHRFLLSVRAVHKRPLAFKPEAFVFLEEFHALWDNDNPCMYLRGPWPSPYVGGELKGACVPYQQLCYEFTPQAKSFHALMCMYSLWENDEANVPLEPIVVFTAFSIEAYLNSLGARVVPFWDEIERSSWRSKVSILHTVAGRQPEWGADPLQFAAEVFKLRDKLAHGKAEQVVGPKVPLEVDPNALLMGPALRPKWYDEINVAWVKQAQERLTNLLGYLSLMLGFPEQDYMRAASGKVQTVED